MKRLILLASLFFSVAQIARAGEIVEPNKKIKVESVSVGETTTILYSNGIFQGVVGNDVLKAMGIDPLNFASRIVHDPDLSISCANGGALFQCGAVTLRVGN